ncbi:MAG: hypothetical protein V4510_02450 [bacterium]
MADDTLEPETAAPVLPGQVPLGNDVGLPARAEPSVSFPAPSRLARPPRPRPISPASANVPPAGDVGHRIYGIVRDNPGIHFRGLGRAALLSSAGQLRHHLDRLERQGAVVEVEDGRYRRFFAAADHTPDLRPGLARFSRAVPRRIGRILMTGPLGRTELRRRLGCADSTLGYHLHRMVRSGDLRKERGRDGTWYALANEDFVRRVLAAQAEHPLTVPSPPDGPDAGAPASDQAPAAA